MGLREDLIAAKALIDTPEKWGSLGTVLAFKTACGRYGKRILAARRAFGAQHPQQAIITHADLMHQFDRAIAACEVQS